MTTPKKGIMGWVDERLELDDVREFMEKKTVPIHEHSIWYYFGGVSLFLFIIQVVTGILLLLYYKGSEDLAFESIQYILTKVEFGWLIRAIHSWAANLFILSIFIHMFSVYFEKAYRKPREMTWYSGVALLGMSLAFGFSGYLLPWNELAFFATKVGTEIAGVVPVIGRPVLEFLRGGEQVTGATLSRFFGFHVAVFPAIFTVFLAIHLILIQRQGMSEPLHLANDPTVPKKTMPFFPNFILRDMLLWLIVLNVLAFLAVFFPWELGLKADPFAPAPAGIEPEWYFMFMFQTLKLIPATIWIFDGEVLGVLLFAVAGLFWAIVPLWDRKSPKGEKNVIVNYIGIGAIVYIIILTIWGWMA